MSEAAAASPHPSEPPVARIQRHWGLLWVWAVPLSALLLVGYLGYEYWFQRGPLITITFETAEGIEPQKTGVRYKAVTLGTVQSVELSEEASHVVVHVRMREEAKPMLTENTDFWVVRPRLGGGLSGIGEGLKTLVSGSYLAMDPGEGGNPAHHFEGLEEPPNVRSGRPGTAFYLEAESLGSISQGAPVFFREVSVGEVLSYHLELESRSVRFRIFIEAPFDDQVAEQTRFWRASGIGIETTARGLAIQLQSMETLFMGGIAFETPADDFRGGGTSHGSGFALHESREAAMLTAYESVPYVSYFQGSVQGLVRGAEVDMYGRPVGAVTDVSLQRDARPGHEGEMAVRVAYALQPRRAFSESDDETLHHPGMRRLVDRGMRVVLGTHNLLTGQKALSLQHTAPSQAMELASEGDALVLPGEVQSLQEVTSALSGIAHQVSQIPFATIGENLDRTLASVRQAVAGPELEQAIVELRATMQQAHALVREARQGLRPALERLPHIAQKLERAATGAEQALGQQGYGADSAVQRNLERMTDEIAGAARSIERLSDYLGRHPEALITGRGGEEK